MALGHYPISGAPVSGLTGAAAAKTLLWRRRRHGAGGELVIVSPGATSQSIDVQVVDDSGLAVTGLVAATFPAVTYSLAGANADVSVTLSDLAALTTAWASGGLKERGGGVYRLDLPNAALATAGEVRVRGEASGKHLLAPWIDVGPVPTTAQQAAAVWQDLTAGAEFAVAGGVGALLLAKLNLLISQTVANSTGSSGTVISSPSAYAAPSDLVIYFDSNVVCQLVSDTSTRIALSALASNPTALAIMKAASGVLEAACLKGGIYAPADLQALAGTVGGQYLVRIVCGIAMCVLYDRRPDPARPTYPLMGEAADALNELENGSKVFGLAAQVAAGSGGVHDIEKAVDVRARAGIVTRSSRYFGRRLNELNG